MVTRRILAGVIGGAFLFLLAVETSAQWRRGSGVRRWAIYESEMQNPVDDPPDAGMPAEFTFARLRFQSYRERGAYHRWGIDANKSERQFIEGVRRLTRIHTRSIEYIVDADSDEIFEWPWLYAVSVGDWNLSDSQRARLRTYLDRGGFLMVDDFHGDSEWIGFLGGLGDALGDRQIIDLPDDAPIFHTLYDLGVRSPIPGLNVVNGRGYERDGVVPHWRAVVDERGRVQVAICFNMDVGDAWEWADAPEYPEQYASMAYRLGINYILYSMTH